MQKLLPLVTAVALALTSSACIVTSRGHHHHGRGSHASRAKCHPSQYWDGHKCRHKGKGHGARKHDGRRK